MERRAIGPAAAQLIGWCAVALGSAAAIAFTSSGEPLAVRLLHHYHDLAHAVALGLASAAAVIGWRRLPRPRLALLAVSLPIVWLLVRGDLAGWAARRAGEDGDPTAWLLLACAAAGLLAPAAHLAGGRLARPRWRVLAVGAAIAAAAGNHLLYPRAYEGLHLLLAWMAALVAGSALVDARAPFAVRPALAAALLVAAAPALLLRPPNDVALAMRRHPGTALAPFLARAHRAGDLPGRPVSGPGAEWYRPRRDHPPVAASGPRLLPPDAIVIHLSIDAVRADLLADPRWKGALPALERLRGESVWFSQARSTGAQTVTTLTSLFTGTHFSQQMWSKRDSPAAQYWPRDDRSVRFPALLAGSGVATANLSTAWWLTGSSGVVGGFAETIKVKSETASKAYAGARELMAAVLARLGRHQSGDLYLFAHFMDPHYPYDRAGAAGSEMERYVSEIRLVDDQLAALVAALEADGRWQRTVLIAMSDHGEAFGEHDTTEHATTLYEEMLRVPILVRVPGLAPRAVSEPVSTIDLGPTVLDLFGLAAPGSMMGQSLVPLLRGGTATALTRPIAAEGRLKQALIAPNGVKAIRDLRDGTAECYHLASDPREGRSRCGGPAADDALNRLRRFFDVHTLRDRGYRPPYRK